MDFVIDRVKSYILNIILNFNLKVYDWVSVDIFLILFSGLKQLMFKISQIMKHSLTSRLTTPFSVVGNEHITKDAEVFLLLSLE